MMKVAILPAILLVMIGVARWQIWKRNNPPVTSADLKVRRILENAPIVQFGPGGKFLSAAQKQTLISHLWVATTSIEATYPSPSGNKMEIWFKAPPGQGSIVLQPDAAFSGVGVEHWAQEPGFDGSPPITISEEDFPLHPASNRFLRAWLDANAP